MLYKISMYICVSVWNEDVVSRMTESIQVQFSDLWLACMLPNLVG